MTEGREQRDKSGSNARLYKCLFILIIFAAVGYAISSYFFGWKVHEMDICTMGDVTFFRNHKLIITWVLYNSYNFTIFVSPTCAEEEAGTCVKYENNKTCTCQFRSLRILIKVIYLAQLDIFHHQISFNMEYFDVNCDGDFLRLGDSNEYCGDADVIYRVRNII